MLIWASVATAILIWAVAIGCCLRSFNRNGRVMLREKIDQQVRELYDTPEGILQRSQDAPANPALVIKHVLLAEEAGDFPEMARRAELVAQRFPKLLHGHLLKVRAAWRQDDLAASSLLMAPVYRRFREDPEVQELAIEHARKAIDWKLSATLSRRMRITAPFRVTGYRFEAEALAKLGRYAAAASVLRRAEAEFPELPELAAMWDELETAQAGSAPG